MDDYTRQMMDLKTLVTRTLEKKGVLAKIRVSITAFFSISFSFSSFASLSFPCFVCGDLRDLNCLGDGGGKKRFGDRIILSYLSSQFSILESGSLVFVKMKLGFFLKK